MAYSMEANSYKKMVQEKNERMASMVQGYADNLFFNNSFEPKHKFKQTFYIQESYEPRKYLWFTFNKKVGQEAIPVGLCAVCDKLEIEHNA